MPAPRPPAHPLSLGLVLALLVTLAGCPTTDGSPDPEPTPGEPIIWPQLIGVDDGRPAEVRGPEGWTGDDPLPVVFVLHGFGVDADLQETFVFRFTRRIEEDRFLLVLPNGTQNPEGQRFWNATYACCDGYGSGVDDVGYLMGLLDELESSYAIDSERVYFTGHSNGGFMSFRMACEHPGRIAAIMPLASSTWLDPEDCLTGAPMSVLDVHGTEDDSVPYNDSASYPGAQARADRWAERAGCDPAAATPGDAMDLIAGVAGAETQVLEYRSGCEGGKIVDLWTLEGVGHLPIFGDGFADVVIPWLLQRSR
jgi:polyhydroxybutyrate depolymerase